MTPHPKAKIIPKHHLAQMEFASRSDDPEIMLAVFPRHLIIVPFPNGGITNGGIGVERPIFGIHSALI